MAQKTREVKNGFSSELCPLCENKIQIENKGSPAYEKRSRLRNSSGFAPDSPLFRLK